MPDRDTALGVQFEAIMRFNWTPDELAYAESNALYWDEVEANEDDSA